MKWTNINAFTHFQTQVDKKQHKNITYIETFKTFLVD